MKYIHILLFLTFGVNLYSQNAVSILRTYSEIPIICRSIYVNTELEKLTTEIINLQKYTNTTSYELDCNVYIQIYKQLTKRSLSNPDEIYGPYNYLKKISYIGNRELNLQNWKYIYRSRGYNGVHHLIMKDTIKLIYEDLRSSGEKVNLMDMQKNCPSIFHPYHGNPKYKHIFHNSSKQFSDYKQFGMKITILGILAEIDVVNQRAKLPLLTKEYIYGVLKEAELWSKTYHIRWD